MESEFSVQTDPELVIEEEASAQATTEEQTTKYSISYGAEKKRRRKKKERKLIVSVEYHLASEFVKKAYETAMLSVGQAPIIWPDKNTNPGLYGAEKKGKKNKGRKLIVSVEYFDRLASEFAKMATEAAKLRVGQAPRQTINEDPILYGAEKKRKKTNEGRKLIYR